MPISFIVPSIIVLIMLFGLVKRVNILESFVEGAKDGLKTVLNIFPVLLLILTAIGVMRQSGLLEVAVMALNPVTTLLGIPKEVVPLTVLRPLSGSGAMAALEDVLSKYGADSRIGRIASTMCAATETTFYTISVYLGSLTQKCGKIIFCALVADLVSVIMSCATCSLF